MSRHWDTAEDVGGGRRSYGEGAHSHLDRGGRGGRGGRSGYSGLGGFRGGRGGGRQGDNEAPWVRPTQNQSIQAHPVQSPSQGSPCEYFPQNRPPLTLQQILRTDAESSWSLKVENFLNKKLAIQSTDNYEEVEMDLASLASTVNVEEAEVVDGQSDQRTKHKVYKDENLRKALLEQQQKELANVEEFIASSEKKIKEYENLEKEFQRTLTAIRTEKKNLQEYHERMKLELLKYKMMDIQENNLALPTPFRQTTPPIEENGNKSLVPEKEGDVMKTSRKRLNDEKEAPVKPKMTRNQPAVVAPKPMVITTISSSSAETLEGNCANERPMLQLPQISTAEVLATALETTMQKGNPRSAHLYTAANSYLPPTLPEPGYIARAERYKWTEVHTTGAYGIGLRVPLGKKQMSKQSSNKPFVNAQHVQKVVTLLSQKTMIEHENKLGEDPLRQKLLARIKKEKIEPDPSAPLITSVTIGDEWEPESPNYYADKTGSGWKNSTKGRFEDALVSSGFEAWPVPNERSHVKNLLMVPLKQEGLFNEPVSRNNDVAAPGDYRSQSPDYVPEGYVYEPTSPNYGIDHIENEITSQPLNSIDERSESSRFENDSISQMQNGDKAPSRKTNLRQRSRGIKNEPVEVPSTSLNNRHLLNANMSLCTTTLLYGQCLRENCRMQHFDNPAFARSEPEPPKEPKEKLKKEIPRLYHGKDAMVADELKPLPNLPMVPSLLLAPGKAHFTMTLTDDIRAVAREFKEFTNKPQLIGIIKEEDGQSNESAGEGFGDKYAVSFGHQEDPLMEQVQTDHLSYESQETVGGRPCGRISSRGGAQRMNTKGQLAAPKPETTLTHVTYSPIDAHFGDPQVRYREAGPQTRPSTMYNTLQSIHKSKLAQLKPKQARKRRYFPSTQISQGNANVGLMNQVKHSGESTNETMGNVKEEAAGNVK